MEAIIQSSKINLVLETLQAVVEESLFELDESGIEASVAHESSVCVVKLNLSESAFATYNFDARTIGVDIEEMNDILSIAEDEPVTLILEDHNLESKFTEVDYRSALIDTDSIDNHQEIPDLDLNAGFGLTSEQFSKAINVSGKVANHVDIGLNESEGVVQFKAAGDDNRVITEFDQEELLDITPFPASATYSLTFLEEINSVIPSETNIHVEFDEEFPMVISYSILDDDGEVNYMLAPRLSE